MKTLLHVLFEAVPRNDRQMMALAVAGSTLLVLIAMAAELMVS
jgi:hypothetical protein